MQTCFNYCSKDYCFASSDERKWINRILTLKEKYPDKITIIALPENNDGCIYAKVPIDWLKLAPKKSIGMTEEQKEKLRQNLFGTSQ